ncbi:hypothetical protein [Sediminitomix flava]|uniref:N-acetyltransferase domain-containing protein n=1 Tax=Sediminitomix flava TaxID=379075 RepID=A0A315Z1K1_SEDFL|nr:hypothetical protein [Sediminitomix flava]PWJ36000.1 hypothetical protein BC781_10913 [Sediminitomix flava]
MKLLTVTNNEHIRQFLECPVQLYKDDPNYIRPFDHDVENVFDPAKNKLFKKGEACRWILVDNQGNTIGRVAAFINPSTVHKDNKQPTGGMGFFDCINNQEAANMLFDQCKTWLTERGMEAMDGPINFGERDRWWGCLAEGYDEPNYCMHYNAPYYNELYQNYGFQVYFKQYTYYRDVRTPLSQKLMDKAANVWNDPDYTFEHYQHDQLEKYALDFHKVYNAAWGGHGGVKVMPEKVAINMFKSMKMVIDAEMMWYAYYKGEPVAFYLQIPELNQIKKKLSGGSFGWWQKLMFMFHRKTGASKKLFALVFGVVPSQQRKGVESAIVKAFNEHVRKSLGNPPEDPFRDFRYESLEMNWIGDFNPKMMRTCELIGGEISKVHHTYRKLFDESVEFERMKIIH